MQYYDGKAQFSTRISISYLWWYVTKMIRRFYRESPGFLFYVSDLAKLSRSIPIQSILKMLLTKKGLKKFAILANTVVLFHLFNFKKEQQQFYLNSSFYFYLCIASLHCC